MTPDLSVGFALWLFAVSFGASLFGGMLGMASGIFIVPILTVFGGIDLHTAIVASIVSVIACSCGGAASFLKNQLTNIRLAVVLESATTSGALVGVLLTGVLPPPLLYILFALILLLSAQQMLARRNEQSSTPSHDDTWGLSARLKLDSTYPDQTCGDDVPYRVQRIPLGMVLMFGAGLISALLGIGSGVLKIPAMDTALRLPIKVSSATSNFMIGVTAAASACAYFARGDIVPAIVGPVVLGSAAGAPVGARILMSTSNERLRLLFAVVLVALAVQMFLSAAGINVFKGGG
jgi:hypothetical protein